MSTCKDCLHYEACGGMFEVIGFVGNGIMDNADKLCDNFKDKSRFVELPTPRLPLVMDRIGTDVYCPNCGGNLSGGWPDSSPDCEWPLYQCFYCGQSLDETKAVTREAAEEALKKEKENEVN